MGEYKPCSAVGIAQEKVKMKSRERDKRNLKWIRLVALAIAWRTILAGCSYEWKKPGMTGALFYKDTRECEAYVRTHYLRKKAAYGPRRVKRRDGNRVTYFTTYPPRSQIEAHLFAECMKKNGYSLVEKKPAKK